MATPVGHYLVGLAITQSMAGSSRERKQGVVLAVVAVLADLDLVGGLFVGNIWAFHRGASHSLTVALAFGLVSLLALAMFKVPRPMHTAAMLFLVYFSHLVLDSMMVDSSDKGSISLLWPWADIRLQAPIALLPSGGYRIETLLSLSNVLVIVRETLVFLPLTALAITLRQRDLPWLRRIPWPNKAVAWAFVGWFAVAILASLALG